VKEVANYFLLQGVLGTKTSLLEFPIDSILLDTGALGSNFISEEITNELSGILRVRPLTEGRRVRMGNRSIVQISKEVDFELAITTAAGVVFTHTCTCAVMTNLAHGIIIGLYDLMGPFYPVFAASVAASRTLLSNVPSAPTEVPARQPSTASITDSDITPSPDTFHTTLAEGEIAYPWSTTPSTSLTTTGISLGSDSLAHVSDSPTSNNAARPKRVTINETANSTHFLESRDHTSYSLFGVPGCGYSPDVGRSAQCHTPYCDRSADLLYLYDLRHHLEPMHARYVVSLPCLRLLFAPDESMSTRITCTFMPLMPLRIRLRFR
jgi:hypothetical protein